MFPKTKQKKQVPSRYNLPFRQGIRLLLKYGMYLVACESDVESHSMNNWCLFFKWHNKVSIGFLAAMVLLPLIWAVTNYVSR